MVTKVVGMLEEGAVMGQRFQTFESHIPYLHQFFIDYNLYGMDFIDLTDGRFRRPILDIPRPHVPDSPSSTTPRFYTDQTVPSDKMWPLDYPVPRQSYCELELDVLVGDISNRYRVKERRRKALIDLVNGTENLGDTKLVPSLAAIWEDETQRRRSRNIPSQLQSSAPETRDPYTPWSNEERLRSDFAASLREALDARAARAGDAEKHPQENIFQPLADDGVPTVFQATLTYCARPQGDEDVSALESQAKGDMADISPMGGHDFASQEYSMFDDTVVSVIVDEEVITRKFATQRVRTQANPTAPAADDISHPLYNPDEDPDLSGYHPQIDQDETDGDHPEEDEQQPEKEGADEEDWGDLNVIYDDPRSSPTPSPAKGSGRDSMGRTGAGGVGATDGERSVPISPLSRKSRIPQDFTPPTVSASRSASTTPIRPDQRTPPRTSANTTPQSRRTTPRMFHLPSSSPSSPSPSRSGHPKFNLSPAGLGFGRGDKLSQQRHEENDDEVEEEEEEEEDPPTLSSRSFLDRMRDEAGAHLPPHCSSSPPPQPGGKSVGDIEDFNDDIQDDDNPFLTSRLSQRRSEGRKRGRVVKWKIPQVDGAGDTETESESGSEFEVSLGKSRKRRRTRNGGRSESGDTGRSQTPRRRSGRYSGVSESGNTQTEMAFEAYRTLRRQRSNSGSGGSTAHAVGPRGTFDCVEIPIKRVKLTPTHDELASISSERDEGEEEIPPTPPKTTSSFVFLNRDVHGRGPADDTAVDSSPPQAHHNPRQPVPPSSRTDILIPESPSVTPTKPVHTAPPRDVGMASPSARPASLSRVKVGKQVETAGGDGGEDTMRARPVLWGGLKKSTEVEGRADVTTRVGGRPVLWDKSKGKKKNAGSSGEELRPGLVNIDDDHPSDGTAKPRPALWNRAKSRKEVDPRENDLSRNDEVAERSRKPRPVLWVRPPRDGPQSDDIEDVGSPKRATSPILFDASKPVPYPANEPTRQHHDSPSTTDTPHLPTTVSKTPSPSPPPPPPRPPPSNMKYFTHSSEAFSPVEDTNEWEAPLRELRPTSPTDFRKLVRPDAEQAKVKDGAESGDEGYSRWVEGEGVADADDDDVAGFWEEFGVSQGFVVDDVEVRDTVERGSGDGVAVLGETLVSDEVRRVRGDGALEVEETVPPRTSDMDVEDQSDGRNSQAIEDVAQGGITLCVDEFGEPANTAFCEEAEDMDFDYVSENGEGMEPDEVEEQLSDTVMEDVSEHTIPAAQQAEETAPADENSFEDEGERVAVSRVAVEADEVGAEHWPSQGKDVSMDDSSSGEVLPAAQHSRKFFSVEDPIQTGTFGGPPTTAGQTNTAFSTPSSPSQSPHTSQRPPPNLEPPRNIFRLCTPAPTVASLLTTLPLYNIPPVIYQDPFFSNPRDVPARTKEFAGREFKFVTTDVENLKEFDTTQCVAGMAGATPAASGGKWVKGIEYWKRVGRLNGPKIPDSVRLWSLANAPPSRKATERWLAENRRTGSIKLARQAADVSQIEAPTPKNPHGFKLTQVQTDAVAHVQDYMTMLSIEMHARSRGTLLPDPNKDPVCAVVYCLLTVEDERYRSNGHRQGYRVGVIIVEDGAGLHKTGICGYIVDTVPNERVLFETLIEKVRHFDPDVLLGYEIHSASWGYLIERAGHEYHIDLCAELSRVIPETANTKVGREEDAWGFRKQSHLHTTGRIFLNVWRTMRSEMNLTSYTLENTVFHVLHKRIPKFSQQSLTEWYDQGMLRRWRTMRYYLERVQYNLELLDDLNYIHTTSEFARVFGIDFFSVITRGSQYKVEAVMARVAHPENFVMISPSRPQVAAQRACECLPLVMEPQSRFYTSPLLVLDFQSLYPSVMIAYNYCYSTCLGRVQSAGKPHKFGVVNDFVVPAPVVELLKDHINVSPNGLAFVKPHIREGVIGRMLTEILDTRVMLKQSMKLYKGDKAVSRVLDARQLGMKFIANVTYGYMGASFSGRMPCVDIADAIVQTGRATLERGIDLIHGTERWGAKVVYGDTDSLFVHLPGVTKNRAFEIGKEVVDTITMQNPEPVKLKFEKVYHPCVLLAKKRYVGFKYEAADEKEPGFDAKGIETVRRDGCVAQAKTLEQCLKILFRTQDLSAVKEYLQRQWTKILSGRVSIQDFIVAKEVKLGTYSDNGPKPAHAAVGMKRMAEDPRAEPQYGERVPYVVVHGGPGHRLVDAVFPPEELLNNRTLRLHGTYYIQKQIIPAISRVFSLIGADVESWFNEMPKVHRAIQFTDSQLQHQKKGGRTIDQYYATQHCLVCHELIMRGKDMCEICSRDPQSSAARLAERLNEAERRHTALQRVCRSCTSHATAEDANSACVSLDCPVLFARMRSINDVRLGSRLVRAMNALNEESVEVRREAFGDIPIGEVVELE
ncbi:DNA polymerase zeta [Borealophlyctis nickersoniae]|nr:DNA polymerase zeta [Borealophlyctis nickersoniae]